MTAAEDCGKKATPESGLLAESLDRWQHRSPNGGLVEVTLWVRDDDDLNCCAHETIQMMRRVP